MNMIKALLSAALAVVCLQPTMSRADYPDKPVRIVVPYAPGGGSDTLARKLADRLRHRLGQPVIIDNKPGANGIIGSEYVTKAAPDGLTFLWVVGAHYINPLVTARMPFHVLNDFTPVTMVAHSPGVMVVKADHPASTVAGFVSHMRQSRAENWSYGSAESTSRLLGAKFMKSQGIDATHVAFKGGSEVVTAIAQGTVSTGFVSVGTARSMIAGGRLKALAITGTQRAPTLPSVPTLAESGVAGFEQANTLFMLLAPKNTPAALVARFQAEVSRSLRDPEMQETLKAMDAIGVGNTPLEFQTQMARDLEFWTRAGVEAGLKVE